MSFEKTNRISGERLRGLREAKSIEISSIARQVNLSVAQLRQLESDQLAPGEKALFYSETIKANAAKKVARALGADLHELVMEPVLEEPLPNGVSDRQFMEDLAQLLQKQARAQRVGQERNFFKSKLLWSALALCVAMALGWYFQQSLSKQIRGIVAPAESAQPPVSIAVPVPAVIAGSEAVASSELPVAAAKQALNIAQPDALCSNKVTGTPLTVAAPSKAGKVVYVVANVDTAVCVQDASGKNFAVNLKAQESRSFLGSAPWKVHFDKPSAIQLFFQGQRMRWPDDEQTSFTLAEVPGAY